MNIDIILPLCDIPGIESSKPKVRHITGSKVYFVGSELVVHSQDLINQKVVTLDGCYILWGDDGSVTAVPKDKRMIWVEPEESNLRELFATVLNE